MALSDEQEKKRHWELKNIHMKLDDAIVLLLCIFYCNFF